MSETNNPKRKVQSKLNRKFGVSEEYDRPIRRDLPDAEAAPSAPRMKPAVPYGGWGDTERPAKEEIPMVKVSTDAPVGPWGNRKERPAKPAMQNRDEHFRDRHDHRPGKKEAFTTLLGSQRQALANPETAEATLADMDPPWLKKILILNTDKGREKQERFLAEGMRCVTEMVQYHADLVDGVYVAEGYDNKQLLELMESRNMRKHIVTPEQMERISTTVTSQGVVAVCRSGSTKPDYDLSMPVTLVDGIQDPGNLGALFRTSLGFGMGMLLGKGTVNPFNPKVVRGSSGTFLRVPFEQDVDMLERIQFLRHKGYTVIATDLHAKQSLEEIPARRLRKVAILVGNEGAGADERSILHADEVVRIPMSKTLESLNVAVAHGILCYQIAQIRASSK